MAEFRLDNLISALVGGAAGGLLVYGLMPTPDATTASPVADVATAAPMAPAAAADPDVTDQRLKRLENSVRNVQKRVIEQAQVDGVVEDEGGEGQRITLKASDPKFQSAVRAVIDKASWEREQEEIDKRDERMDRRVDQQVTELVEELDLSDEQSDQVEIVMRERMDAFRALRSGDERPVTRRDWREKFQEIQAETRKKLADILEEDQLASYDKLQEENGMGPWSRGRRPQPPAPR